MNNRTVGFLLGAGVSIPCNAPSAAKLTEDLMKLQIPYFRHTDERYYPHRGGLVAATPAGLPTLSEIRRFICNLHDRVSSYYVDRIDPAGCSERTVNYEDIAYLAVQASEGISRERDNPALTPFIDELISSFGPREALHALAEETIGLITDHVAHRLNGLKATTEHLACIRDACRANRQQAVSILSLNNDCLIEDMLAREKIAAVNDMTSLQDDGRRIVTVAPSASGVNLFKLHGSIDWFRWRTEAQAVGDGFWGEWVGYAPPTPSRLPWSCEGRPVILVGRFNKELSYASSPFAELFSAARASLREVSRLVVSGYSFGDKAVNTMLVEWLYGAPKGSRQLIVAHADPSNVRIGSRGAIGNKWNAWIKGGLLLEIPKFLGDLSWPELCERVAA